MIAACAGSIEFVTQSSHHMKVARANRTAWPEGLAGRRGKKIGLVKKIIYVTRDAAINWERERQEHIKSR